jgi:ATP-dependent Clp protease ATP-binding subunit ClpA
LEAVRQQVEEIIGHGQQAPGGRIPLTPRAKKVLELSLREALQLGHNYIGTEHLLLGLIREGEGVAAQVLVELGGDLNRVRQMVSQVLSGYQGTGPVTGPLGHHVEWPPGMRWARGPSLRPVSDDAEVAAIRDSLGQLSPVAQAVLNSHLAQLTVDAAGDRSPTAEGLRSLINVIRTLQSQDQVQPPDTGSEPG